MEQHSWKSSKFWGSIFTMLLLAKIGVSETGLSDNLMMGIMGVYLTMAGFNVANKFVNNKFGNGKPSGDKQ